MCAGAVCLILLSLPDTAHAYLDPGSGSLVVQALVAAAAALSVAVKIYWHKLIALFRILKRPGKATQGEKKNGHDASGV